MGREEAPGKGAGRRLGHRKLTQEAGAGVILGVQGRHDQGASKRLNRSPSIRGSPRPGGLRRVGAASTLHRSVLQQDTGRVCPMPSTSDGWHLVAHDLVTVESPRKGYTVGTRGSSWVLLTLIPFHMHSQGHPTGTGTHGTHSDGTHGDKTHSGRDTWGGATQGCS